jgi:3'-phosphoadenosine 5'-phosphosulfate sulfotransferase (PAPS reductase)/FAD synthetase
MEQVVHDEKRLKELQALPLERKILISQTRIIEWYQHYDGKVCVSFSGGKDSTVLLHLVHTIYPDVPAVYSNTGLEYPEIRQFAVKQNAIIVTPEVKYFNVLRDYGYPLISKDVAETIYYARRLRDDSHEDREVIQNKKTIKGDDVVYEYTKGDQPRYILGGYQSAESNTERSQYQMFKWLPLAQELPVMIHSYCCNAIKKAPLKKWMHVNGSKPYIGILASESRVRRAAWVKTGCNAFDSRAPRSMPMSFWTEQDVLSYIVKYGLEIASVYGKIVSRAINGCEYEPVNEMTGEIRNNLACTGCERTGCIWCGFGVHLESPNKETRYQRLARTHPKQYEYCIGGGEWADNPAYDPTAPKYDGQWKNWNPKKIWVPNKKGLGMGKLYDMVNELYGETFIRYK